MHNGGKLGRAEEMYQKSLDIFERLGHREGMANQYGNLGVLYQVRGELGRAEEMYLSSLQIDTALNRIEGMANQYRNLGVLYMVRGELDRAEDMHLKGLKAEEDLKREENIARQYANLGILYRTRGDLDRAALRSAGAARADAHFDCCCGDPQLLSVWRLGADPAAAANDVPVSRREIEKVHPRAVPVVDRHAFAGQEGGHEGTRRESHLAPSRRIVFP